MAGVMAGVTASQALAEARRHLGTRENPDGSNKTPFGVLFGWNGVAWCAIWVWNVFANLKAEALLPKKTASTAALAKAFADAGRFGSEPRRGALVFYAWYGPKYEGRFKGICHVGFVEEARTDGRLTTLEGNVSNMVKRLVRALTYVAGYGYPEYAEESVAAKPKKRRVLRHASPLMRGGDVERVQRYLLRKGISVGKSGADGIYGPATEAAVRRYQTKRLPRYIRGENQWDGIVGPHTWALIDAGK